MMVMVVRTWRTGPANPTHGCQALMMCLEPTTRETAGGVVMGAPVRLSGFFDADDGRENSQDEQQRPHGRLLVVRYDLSPGISSKNE
jgi:hypothetical protein